MIEEIYDNFYKAIFVKERYKFILTGIKNTLLLNRKFNDKNTKLKNSNLKEVWTFAIFRPVIYVLYMTYYTILVTNNTYLW